MLDRAKIKLEAKKAFQEQYWPAVMALVVMTLIMSVFAGLMQYFGENDLYTLSSFASLVMSLLIFPFLMVGLAYFFLKVYRGKTAEIIDIFEGFKNFAHVWGGMLWMYLWVFLWTLLFIIPGIIKAFAYMMTPYILVDKPELSAQEALKLSIKMTDGHKWELFVVGLSFIGWQILNVLTCCMLGVFFVNPYMNTTFAAYYEKLK